MKKRIILVIALLLCVSQLASCNYASSSRVIDNVGQEKFERNSHVEDWLDEDRRNSFLGITNHLLVYKTQSGSKYLHKVIILRDEVEKQAKVDLEFIEDGDVVTVKIKFTDAKADAEDGRTVSFVQFSMPFSKTVYYDVVYNDVDVKEDLQTTDKNIAM